jgi:hypothetical protein
MWLVCLSLLLLSRTLTAGLSDGCLYLNLQPLILHQQPHQIPRDDFRIHIFLLSKQFEQLLQGSSISCQLLLRCRAAGKQHP